MLEGEKNLTAADAKTEQDYSRQPQGWSTPKLPRWDSLVPEEKREEGRGSEHQALRPSMVQDKSKIRIKDEGAQLVSGWH